MPSTVPRGQVRAATGELLQQARDAVPDDVSASSVPGTVCRIPAATLCQVADWTAEGGELAAAYLGAGAGYLGEYLEPEYLQPRLDQLLLTLARCPVCSTHLLSLQGSGPAGRRRLRRGPGGGARPAGRGAGPGGDRAARQVRRAPRDGDLVAQGGRGAGGGEGGRGLGGRQGASSGQEGRVIYPPLSLL